MRVKWSGENKWRREEEEKEVGEDGENKLGLNIRKVFTIITLDGKGGEIPSIYSVLMVNVHHEESAEISQKALTLPPSAWTKLWGWDKKVHGEERRKRKVLTEASLYEQADNEDREKTR